MYSSLGCRNPVFLSVSRLSIPEVRRSASLLAGRQGIGLRERSKDIRNSCIRPEQWGIASRHRSHSPPLRPLLVASVVVDEVLVNNTTTPEIGNQGIAEYRGPMLPDATIQSKTSVLFDGLTSRPVPGGNWDPEEPLRWCKDFGRRSSEYENRLSTIARLSSDDVSSLQVENTTIVRTKEQARTVVDKLMSADTYIFHACDTEVMDIDLKEVGPVGNGYVTCVSIYSGPDFDYGLGQGPGTTLWIDNLDDAYGVLQEFKEWFEDERFLKVWHNYGFDRHVLWNEGIDVKGFGGDTMHMARLQDTSRLKNGGGGYSLEALTGELLTMRKKPMKEIFGVPRLRKDGTPGSLVDIPPVEVLQRDPRFRRKFIKYSCYDAIGTWKLHEKLVNLLKKMIWMDQGSDMYDYYWSHMREFGEVLTDMERRGIRVDAKDYLASVEKQARKDRNEHSKKFRKWASEQIGVDGLALNPASAAQLCTFLFGGAKNGKTNESTESIRVFKVAREEIPDDALDALVNKQRETLDDDKTQESDQLDQMTAAQLKALCKEYELKVSGNKADLKQRIREYLLETPSAEMPYDELNEMSLQELKQSLAGRGITVDDTMDPASMINILRNDMQFMSELQTVVSADFTGHDTILDALQAAASQGGATHEILANLKEKSMEEPKFLNVTIKSLGMKPLKYTAGGAPSVTADVLRQLAGDPSADPPRYGSAYDFFGGGTKGHDACVALFSLCAIGSIDTMIANFLTSLQSLTDHQSRVHCSLNLNTETGRLSSRRPNLQNQPALEKDKYKIRKAFQASPGNSLIVADYGQLELRLLASMTNCKSMINAFASGGDFHSRTALDMFDHVKEKVEKGEVLLEWDFALGDPPKPLLKDEFASERRKAKTLNFSIAYGKTAHGLSQDWGVTQEEAQEMLQKWYDARPEVRDWQSTTKRYARKLGLTRTLMGRYRQIPEAMGNNKKLIGHAERASINTPIQGGAADVAMMAMNKINRNGTLKRLGWILLMQIHDEVILEGPEETAKEAFQVVVDCMENPWVTGLAKTAVPLLVDGSYEHKTWYDAK
ncbi:DNA polymerase I [Nitzschia inconspicua]|uniref:DNA polymerase I n=1 Tax=Nitzschia inconspicua TaxID=303405 RepID=A0A9K3LL24_9STRA|nr:DNA polymerase I [Nitzschia inconspicua]